MGTGTSYPLVDRILDGKLEALLRDWREAGLSHERIVLKLHTEHDITVTAVMVRRWCNALGIGSAS